MEKKTSIIILNYNTPKYLQLCLDSIRKYTKPYTYEIIVVDNHSTDGKSLPYLKEQEIKFDDITCIYNDENLGFPKGCNQGIMMSAKGNDILLLNSDTIVMPRYLTQLQTALYHDEKIGATSCVTNYCSNFQKIPTSYTSIPELEEFADKYNHLDPKKWVYRDKLVAFCLLIRREVVDKIGLLDEIFTPGNFEDDDYSYRIRQAGYRLLLLKDTFIHHFGSGSFINPLTEEERTRKIKAYNELLERNQKLFLEKWHLDDSHGKGYFSPLTIKKIFLSLDFWQGRILFIDKGSDVDLFILQSCYPKAKIEAVFFNEAWAKISAFDFKVYFCRAKEEIFNQISTPYDLIFIPGNLGTIDEDTVQKLRTKVKKTGRIILFFDKGFSFLRGTAQEKNMNYAKEKLTKAKEDVIKILLANIEADKDRQDSLCMLDTFLKEEGLGKDDIKIRVFEEATNPSFLYDILEKFWQCEENTSIK